VSNPRSSKFRSDEDDVLAAVVAEYGTGDWNYISTFIPDRNARQCRERWSQYLDPDLQWGVWSESEDSLLESLFARHGTKWHTIAQSFNHRSSMNVRNRYYQLARRKRTGQVPEKASSEQRGGLLLADLLWPSEVKK
jgi:hypothetical protein